MTTSIQSSFHSPVLYSYFVKINSNSNFHHFKTSSLKAVTIHILLLQLFIIQSFHQDMIAHNNSISKFHPAYISTRHPTKSWIQSLQIMQLLILLHCNGFHHNTATSNHATSLQPDLKKKEEEKEKENTTVETCQRCKSFWFTTLVAIFYSRLNISYPFMFR